MVIKVENLVKIYGPIRAVDGLSFEVAQGGVFGMLGPNGAGKTTTVEIIERLMGDCQGNLVRNLANGHGIDPPQPVIRVGRYRTVPGIDVYTTLDSHVLAFPGNPPAGIRFQSQFQAG